ncbi:MAG: hypothetical protein AAFN63_17280 [Pseudomonadota bacterium]
MAYINEKLFAAVLGMSRSNQPIRQRLKDAYIFSLIHADHQMHDWGDEIQERLDEIREQLTQVEDAEHGSVNATVDAMSDAEVEECIEKICGIIFLLEAPKK